MDAELLRGLVAKWRSQADSAMRSSGTWSGDQMADRVAWMADELEAALTGPLAQGWVPVSERMPPDDLMVLVYWTEEGEDRYDFEATEAGVWIKHAEHYDNYLSVALPENSRGPSEQAPYTHWRTVEAPAAPAQPGGVE